MEHELPIDRDEVLVIMGALADLRTDVSYIRDFFEDFDEDEEEDEGAD